MSLTEELSQLTFRIEVDKPGGVSTGTGFILALHENEFANTMLPVLVTNKHVIEDGTGGRLIVSATTAKGEIKHTPVNLGDFQSLWKLHPDDSIDLAAMSISPLIEKLQAIKLTPRIKSVQASVIPTPAQLRELSYVEDILMIGYPNGLWDEVNNLPLFRKGITSTHAGKDFQGQKQFVIDIAAFPGSSGSPVFIFNEGSYATSAGLSVGTRLKLLGVLYAGPQFAADGTIVIKTVPTTSMPVSSTLIPMNLGYVISSQVLMDFESVFTLTV